MRLVVGKTTNGRTHVYCADHPDATLRCPGCMGAKGGKSKSTRKRRASRRNAALAREAQS